MARLPSLRALFTRARDTVPAPIAEVAADRQAAGVELLDAQRAVEAAQAAFDAGLLDPAADRRALDDARRDAALRLDAAKALCGAFAMKAVEAQAAERKAELARIVAEADRAQAAFEELARNDLPAIGIAVRGLIRAEAEAKIANDAADRAIAEAGTGERRLPIGAFRGAGGRLARTLRSEEFDGWCEPTGELAGHNDQIVRQQDGSGFLRIGNATHSKRYTLRRRFERREVLAAEPVRIPAALAETISIPGLRADDAPIWSPMMDQTPNRILAELDRVERYRDPEGDSRQPSIIVRAVGPVTEVAKPAHVPNLRAS